MSKQVPVRQHAHRKSRIEARKRGARTCFWCRAPFGDRRPPTREHIYTKAERRDGAPGDILFACADCNHARGAMSFEEYTDLVVEEHLRSRAEARKFRPVKGVQPQ